MVWTEGLATWVPYQSSAAAESSLSTAAPGITHVCAECKKSFREEDMLNYENSWVCAACKPIFFQRVKEGVVPLGALSYASVWHRWYAVFIDGLILAFFTLLPQIVMYGGWTGYVNRYSKGHLVLWMTAVDLLLSYGVPVLFETFFIGKFGATPGKMLLKIKVVMPDGGRVSYLRAFGRHYAKIISSITLMIGYMMAIWDEEKRALHDRICATRVINNLS